MTLLLFIQMIRSSKVRIVLQTAVFSRVFVVFLAVAGGYLVRDYDSSSSIELNASNGTIDNIISYLRPLGYWDGVYFQKIAESGYDYEQMHAFFPLYPFTMRVLATGLKLSFLTKED